MKAGSTSDIITQIEWLLIITPLKAEYSPTRWKKFLDVMILKKIGGNQPRRAYYSHTLPSGLQLCFQACWKTDDEGG
jgi:hypothetical protein